MPSGLLPDAAARRRAGVVVPPAVTPVLSLPVWLVFVGTVLLSVALRCCGVRRAGGGLGSGGIRRPVGVLVLGTRCHGASPDARSRRASPRSAPLAGHGKPLR